MKATAYPRQSSTLESHRGSRQMQESINVQLEKSFRLPTFSEQMVLATVQGSILEGPYLLECNEKRLPCVVARALVQPEAEGVPIY